MLSTAPAGVVANVKIGEEYTAVGSSIGVRQGARESPVLFLFIMQAVLETVEWLMTRPTYRARADGVTAGSWERPNRKCGVASLELLASLFAGDFPVFFKTREGILTGTPCLFNHCCASPA